jgi:class 3 adenylate cyclase
MCGSRSPYDTFGGSDSAVGSGRDPAVTEGGWHTGRMNTPAVKFASTSDDLRIAYMAWGEGPAMVIAPPIISNVEMAWENDHYRRVFERIGQHAAVIMFDKRGIGMSDSFDEPPTNEQRISDFLAVMDAEDVERAHISGISEGGVMAQILAVAHPDRVDRLIVSNSMAPRGKRRRVAELAHPPLLSRDELLARWDEVTEHWGEPTSPAVPWIMPSLADNEPYRVWHARFERQSATRTGIRNQLESVDALDTTGIPQQIRAPTLITHTTGDQVINVGHGRVLAELIPTARLIEFDGQDHFWWIAPNWRDILDSQIEFLTGGPAALVVERSFATVLFTDLVGSTAAAAAAGDQQWAETLNNHDHIAQRIVHQHSGTVVKSTGDGLLATFGGPSLAVGAAAALRAQLADIGLSIRAGIHAGEIEHRSRDIAGFAVNLAARVENAAPNGEIYVTSTVRDLLLGGSFKFEDAGAHELKGIEGSWLLCRLV